MALIEAAGTVVLSPSDITAVAECEFGWLRGIDVRLGRTPALPIEDPFVERIARLGDAHEERELERLRAVHDVVVIQRPQPYTVAGLRAAAETTRAALAARTPVVAQATFFDAGSGGGSGAGFGGAADFVVLGDDGLYQVWDAKLARHARTTALLQLAAYADHLDRWGVPRSPVGVLLLGDGSRYGQPLTDVLAVLRHRRDRVTALVTEHLAGPAPAPWGDEHPICGTCAHCEAEIAANDDVLAVAGLTRSQRRRLRAAGIVSVADLAASTATVPDLAERTWRTLRAQAVLQRRGTTTPPAVEVFDVGPLDRLPEPDRGDVFFDFEGDPLWTGADGVMAGLEYLFGVLDLDDPKGRYTPFWAHDRAAEREALQAFLTWVRQRRAQYPDLHIYHYAPYEPTALRRLTARHGVGEDVLDDLLRAGVFVDLYATVRQSLRVASPSYSIKKLEPLYMGEDLRSQDGVTTAADSVLVYHEVVAAREAGDPVEADRLLAELADYNHYDCVSTWRLRDWLLTHRSRTGAWVQPEVPEGGQSRIGELQEVADRVLAGVPADRGDRTAEQQGVALLAAALGYFRREDKPMWWAYFDRCVSPVDEWLDSRSTLVAGRVEVVVDWIKDKRTFKRTVRMTGRLDAGSALDVGKSIRGVYDDVPDGWELGVGQSRVIGHTATVTTVSATEDGDDVVEFQESTKSGAPPHDELPMAVFAHSYIGTAMLETAIETLAVQVIDAGTAELPPDPAADVLAQRAPRMTSGVFDAATVGNLVTPDALVATLRDLDRSYLAVQGPPGTGKTYLGSRAVAALVAAGWRTGVVAQSHAVVENFFRAVIEAGADPARVGKKPKDKPVPGATWTQLADATLESFAAQPGGLVVGGTAWTFAGSKVTDLDLLVVDEAGQFSLAHTIAASRSTKRLLLLGDPQQLPQVSQGAHPEPVQTSALGWLTDGHETIPPDLGVFLARTRRMHSELTDPVSDLAYDGRLAAHTDITDTRSLSGVAPGLHPVPIDHQGNSVTSVEEAHAVVALVERLSRETWQDAAASAPRPVDPSDVIVVAPYNAQVATIRRALDAAGFEGTKVGTVDRFQGQEAAVSIVSLAASSVAEVPRGLEFLLDRQRLNVAISRGQWAAYLVHSPALADALPTGIPALEQLGAFLRLVTPRRVGDPAHPPQNR